MDTRLTKAEIFSLTRHEVDLGRNYRFTPEDLRGWPGHTPHFHNEVERILRRHR